MILPTLLALAFSGPAPSPAPEATPAPTLALYRDGYLWKEVPVASLFPTRAVAVADVVRQLGFARVRAVGVRSRRKVEVLDWARISDPVERPSLVMAGPDVVNLFAHAGPRAPVEKHLLGVQGLDLRGPFDAEGGLLEPDAGQPRPIEVVQADGSRTTIELSVVKDAATRDVEWNGRARRVVPLGALLARAGVPAGSSVRVVAGEHAHVVEQGGAGLADVAAWVVMLNKRGLAVLLHEDALGDGPRPGSAADDGSGELRRLERIEVLPPQHVKERPQ